MKKMLSLAAMFAVLSYASPASAELKIGGDASIRARAEFIDEAKDSTDDTYLSYRIRLNASADLGSGYFFKTMITEDNTAGGWTTVSNGNVEAQNLEISQFYFGRKLEECHYAMGRLPLGSVNNPIFDLALYPISSNGTIASNDGNTTVRYNTLDLAYATRLMDRLFGFNYGRKIGDGELNTTLFAYGERSDGDSSAEGDGILGDSYGLHLSYKFNVGDVTVDPQAIIALTDGDGSVYQNCTSNTIGANVSVPAGDVKIDLSGFYTWAQDDNGQYNRGGFEENEDGDLVSAAPTNVKVDYDGYLCRVKATSGPVTAWVDYNHTSDDTEGRKAEYDNIFVWASYKYTAYESAAGSLSFTPTVRYLAAGVDDKDGFDMDMADDYQRLRTEVIATVTF